MKLFAALRRVPFAAGLSLALVVAALATGSAVHGLRPHVAVAFGFHVGDLDARWEWSFLTATFYTSNAAGLLLALAMVLGCVGLAERTMGTWRTMVAFGATQLAAVVVLGALVDLSGALGLEWLGDMRHATLPGPYAASIGALMAASGRISVLWRRRLRLLTLAAALMLILYVGLPQNALMLCAVLAGLLLGPVLVHRPAPAHPVRSTSREVRTTLAMVVAVFALGPLFAALAHTARGPLAVLRNVVLNPVPTIAQLQGDCTTAAGSACAHLTRGLGLAGPGGELLALAPMVLLLACAEGLRRGSRTALWVTVFLHLVIGVLSALYLQLFAGFGLALHRGRHQLSDAESVLELLPVVLVPFLIAGALFLGRRNFNVDPDPKLRRRVLWVLLAVLAGFVALYTVVWLAEGNANGRAGAAGLIAGLPRILLPYPFPFRYGIAVYPHGFFSTLLFTFGGAAFWLVAVVCCLALFLSRRINEGTQAAARAEAARLVRRGGDSLSWMTLWPRNRYWFNGTRTVGIAYQPHFGVAVTVGGPFGEPADRTAALGEFLQFCADETLVPCLYSVPDELWAALEPHGFRRVAVAEETLLDIRTMEFKGKAWQNVRTALNKAAKLGITVHWSTYSALPGSFRTQIQEISEEWVSERALPEMGFTLGGVEELKDDQVLLALAVDAAGTVHGVTSWLPVFADGRVVSWTLDFMRRTPESFNGVMEFLLAEAVRHFKDQTDVISLSGSPLAFAAAAAAERPGGSGSGPESGAALERILALLGRALEPVYGFASLAQFKQRFQPRHRTLYLMYQDPLALPAIGRAVAEAYMPNLSMRHSARLLRDVVG